MSVGIRVGSIADEIGTGSFLHAFFSTISAHCDGGKWGSCYPHLFELYAGHLPTRSAIAAVGELRNARSALLQLAPSQVVWDIQNPAAQPPWGNNIAPNITSLGTYFVSSTGRDLFELLEDALTAAAQEKQDAFIE